MQADIASLKDEVERLRYDLGELERDRDALSAQLDAHAHNDGERCEQHETQISQLEGEMTELQIKVLFLALLVTRALSCLSFFLAFPSPCMYTDACLVVC